MAGAFRVTTAALRWRDVECVQRLVPAAGAGRTPGSGSHPVTCPVRSLVSERRSHAGWGDRMQCTQSFGEHRSGRFSSHPLAGRPQRGQMISSIASPISGPRASVRGEVTASRGPGNILACHLTDKEDSSRVCQYLYLVLIGMEALGRCPRSADNRMLRLQLDSARSPRDRQTQRCNQD